MAIEDRILFVEGPDDQHTVYAIRDHFLVPKNFNVVVPDGQGKINPAARPHERGGIDNVFKAAQVSLIAGSDAIERLGIVIDADENLGKRWNKVRAILIKAGYERIPDLPNANGTIVAQEFLPTFGVWIMPDNQLDKGYLETFLTFLVPKDSPAWEQAKQCVEALENKPFVKVASDHTTKAEIHTYLAWQEEPGKPFGQAITAKYLQADNPKCEEFVSWLRRLFVD